jgi:hypothetical protein
MRIVPVVEEGMPAMDALLLAPYTGVSVSAPIPEDDAGLWATNQIETTNASFRTR